MSRKGGSNLYWQMAQALQIVSGSGEQATVTEIRGSYQTSRDYLQWLHHAADYYKGKGIKNLSQIDRAAVQAYSDDMQARGLSASTIHNYLAPLCLAAGVPLASIKKPIRKASEFKRSKGSGSEAGAAGSGRAFELNRCIGVRESELKQLIGGGLIVDQNGDMWVDIRRGKGGKHQLQFILPENRDTVRAFFDGVAEGERVLSPADFDGNADYHGQRRELAIAALRHFSDALAAGGEQYRRKVYGTIAGRYHADNRKHSRLEPYSHFDKPYRLRGDNKALAEEQGKAVELDRLAIRAVSVLFTAHWRDNITVQSYYFGR